MHAYPLLTATEQAALPSLNAEAVSLKSQFEDSTHQVFLCDTVDGDMVLKVCDEAAVAKSGFWQGANQLFAADFPNSLSQIQGVHDLLGKQDVYAVPTLVASNSRFVLTHYVDGEDMTAAQVTDAMVAQLAEHIAQLHQQTKTTWGSLHKPTYQAAAWPKRLQTTITTLAEKSTVTIPEPLLQAVLAVAGLLEETEFVPMMLDLRWDQFRKIANAKTDLALLDLDAVVLAPRALDLVLMEYVLTPEQFALFKRTYSKKCDWPDYAMQKPCYQLLLFLMQVLGETDLEKWMNHA